ncbi:hypothetical protein [Deinococcus cellulosilyticus]|uniref:Uncharacterized protein n=1 Tax=Deinococcus cellulosilyticus (strain DSM 18568 / NBRC 106333 / KACC 11606 / 5516J-15) TaxID=1223518 RepID=A0A511MY98_DEIC1|nr:hypothetical protein [Deinococcus cellulosilyticus]GEM45543.1 hypothetical protein DC3_11780 [Deinococcus cellulosilyticus NBRC 106333 = KACC 11606]
MALPKKLKGYRKISHQGQAYRWILLPGARQSILKVIPETAGQTLQVTLTDWTDPWLQSPGEGTRNQPLQITPGVVGSILQQALQGGWQPQQPQAPFQLSYTQQQLMALSK